MASVSLSIILLLSLQLLTCDSGVCTGTAALIIGAWRLLM